MIQKCRRPDLELADAEYDIVNTPTNKTAVLDALALKLYGTKGTYIVTVTGAIPGKTKCRNCNCTLITQDINHRRCLSCRVYLRINYENVFAIKAHRESKKYYSAELESTAPKPVFVVWISDEATTMLPAYKN